MCVTRELYPPNGREVLIIGGGIKICVEQIEELKVTEGIQGLHLMTLEWEQVVSRALAMVGLSPCPHSE